MRKNSASIILSLAILMLSFTGTSMTSAEVVERKDTLIMDAIGGRIADPTAVYNPFTPGFVAWAGLHQTSLEPLFVINVATGEYVPWLAEGYEYRDGDTKLVIYIRRGVTWSDGVKFTADDVVFTFNMLLENAALLQHSMVKANVESVRKLDDYTVEFALTAPNPRLIIDGVNFPITVIWPSIWIVPKHIWQDKDPIKFTFYPPVGTGPYKLVIASETESVWERRDDWWVTEIFHVRPAPKRVIYGAYGESSAKAIKMIAHELDSIWQLMPGLLLQARQSQPSIRTWSLNPPYGFPGACPRPLIFNLLKYPWSIPEVRRAVAYLIDRETIATVALENAVIPAETFLPLWGVYRAFNDAVRDLIEKYKPAEYDPQKAQELFESLGFTKGADGVWVTPNGTRLEITIIARQWDPDSMAMVPVISEQLKAGGVDATWKPLTGAPYSEIEATGMFDSIQEVICTQSSDPIAYFQQFHSKFLKPIGEWASYNAMRLKDERVDEILDEWFATSPDDVEKTTSLYRELMEIFYGETIMTPIVHAPDGLAVYDTYYWVGWPSEDNPYISPWPHCPTALIMIVGYPSPKAGTWVGGLRPREVDYAITYFTKDVAEFRGIDLTWYGPFKAGDAARIPADDAEFWIRKGSASYTPPTPGPVIPPEIPEMARAIQTLVTDVSDLKTGMAGISGSMSGIQGELEALRGQTSMLATVAAVEGVAIIILAALAVLLRRKPAE